MADISKITLPDGSEYDLKDARAREIPLESRTYTNIIATANDNNGGGFFYLKVRGTTYDSKWKVKVHVHATVPGNVNYDTDSDFIIWGRQNTYSSYFCWNNIFNTSYRPIYSNSVFFASSTGYTNNCANWIGFNLYNSTNPINTSYKRTITVDLLSYENCEVELQDELITPTNIPNRSAHTNWYSSTNTSFSNFDACSNGLKQTGDANTTNVTNVYSGNGNYIADSALYRYQLLFQTDENTLTPLTNANNVTAATKTMLTDVEFDPFGRIFYYNTTTAVAAGANIGVGSLYHMLSGFDARYGFNITTSTFTAHKPLYLVVTPLTNGKCKIASVTPWAQELPTTNDGKWYIYIGRTYSGYQCSLYPYHPVYYHDGISIKRAFPLSIVNNLVLESTGDSTDRTNEIVSLLTTYKKCILGNGIFYTTGINMPDDSTLIGMGDATVLKKKSGGSRTYVVKMNKNNTVSRLLIDGNNTVTSTTGTHHGILWEGDYSTSKDPLIQPQNGKLSDLTIKNCDGGGITCNDTGTKRFNNMIASNVAINNCNTGIYIPFYSEYHRFTNIDAFECYYGCINNGGNNCFANCDFSDSKEIGFVIDNSNGDKTNNSHGTCIGCSFNHIANNVGLALSLNGVTAGFTFGNCNIFRGSVEIINCTGVEITDSLFGTGLTITITDSRAIVFTENSFQSAPTVTKTNSPYTYFRNCFDYGTGDYIPDSDDIDKRIDNILYASIYNAYYNVSDLTDYLSDKVTGSVALARIASTAAAPFFESGTTKPTLCHFLKGGPTNAYFLAMTQGEASVGNLNVNTSEISSLHDLAFASDVTAIRNKIDNLFVRGTNEFNSIPDLVTYMNSKINGDMCIVRINSQSSYNFFKSSSQIPTMLLILKGGPTNAYYFAFNRYLAAIGNINLSNSTVEVYTEFCEDPVFEERSVTYSYTISANGTAATNLKTLIDADLPSGYSYVSISGTTTSNANAYIYTARYYDNNYSLGIKNMSAASVSASAIIYYLCRKQ